MQASGVKILLLAFVAVASGVKLDRTSTTTTGYDRYVRVSAAPGDYLNLAEVDVYDSAGTALTLTSGSMGSVWRGLWPATECNDDNLRTFCASDVGGNWVQYRFSSPSATITVSITNRHDGYTSRIIGGSMQILDIGENVLYENTIEASCGTIANTNGICTWSPTTIAVYARQDPHMQNIRGERFDVKKQGLHTLLQIPRFAAPEGTLLRVEGLVRSYVQCRKQYIKRLNFTGSWVAAGQGGLSFDADAPTDAHRSADMLTVPSSGPVTLLVKFGATRRGAARTINYLNFRAQHLGDVKLPVGGILGLDNYIYATKRECGGDRESHAEVPPEEDKDLETDELFDTNGVAASASVD